ncbi:MAG TPA: FAD-dependent oxidoreductase [Gaiellaceae bacterium]|nr:FAD-dependent oxidoreductase [Gaiellaceae bacterium]
MSEAPFRVVIAGGGVAGLEAVLALRSLAENRVSIELIAPEHDFVYRPLAVAEPFRAGEARSFPLARLVEDAGASLRRDRVAAVDLGGHVVELPDGGRVEYDALLVALGARPHEAVPGALTFAGPQSSEALRAVLDEILAGQVHRIAFALPSGVTWSLPLYELALLTANFAVDHMAGGVEIALVTSEDRPLALFGEQATETIVELLEEAGVELYLGTTPVEFAGGELQIAPGGSIEAERTVALPRLEGPRLPGLPCDRDGFISIDSRCRVSSEVDVFAVGDATQFPLKQGGIAAEQADTAAEHIAALAGAPVEPEPFKPVFRGLLLTGMAARYLRSEPGGRGSEVDTEALWWPPAKISGHYLAPFLASKLGIASLST